VRLLSSRLNQPARSPRSVRRRDTDALTLLLVPPSAGEQTWKFAAEGRILPSALVTDYSAAFIEERELRKDEKWW